jgi:hypothetical protein
MTQWSLDVRKTQIVTTSFGRVRSDCWSLGVCALLVLSKSEEKALEQALGMSLKALAQESLPRRTALIREPITRAFDQRVDGWVIEMTAQLLSNGQAERPEAADIADRLGKRVMGDVYCCVPWSLRGFVFWCGVLMAIVFLATKPMQPGTPGKVRRCFDAMLVLGGLPFWGGLVLRFGLQNNVELRLICCKMRGHVVHVPALCRLLGNWDIGLPFAVGCMFLSLVARTILSSLVFDDGFVLGDMVAWVVMGSFVWTVAVRVYAKKQRRAAVQVPAFQGLEVGQCQVEVV